MAGRVEARHLRDRLVTKAALLTPESLPAIQQALRDAALDGWLLYEFRGTNPIAMGILGIERALSRRIFAMIPAAGVPVAITHNIEQQAWRDWPASWERRRYSAWGELESLLVEVAGGKRVAMEYSAGDAVPYLDRVPAGMLEMVRAAGAEVESSMDLVSAFYARWSHDDLAAHRRAAAVVSGAAHDAFAWLGSALAAGNRVHEHDLQRRILDAFARAGLETYAPPNVSFGANAADPHYEPSAEHPRVIERGQLLLIDLWAREPGRPYADQTWMAAPGGPSARAVALWEAVRDARDAAISLLRERLARGATVLGADVDDAARAVMRERGLAAYFTHRTGHSIDPREIHGSGPNLDNLETRDVRSLVPGVGFSIEPGAYVRGEIGVRTEVNAFIDGASLVITPGTYQHDLIVP